MRKRLIPSQDGRQIIRISSIAELVHGLKRGREPEGGGALTL